MELYCVREIVVTTLMMVMILMVVEGDEVDVMTTQVWNTYHSNHPAIHSFRWWSLRWHVRSVTVIIVVAVNQMTLFQIGILAEIQTQITITKWMNKKGGRINDWGEILHSSQQLYKYVTRNFDLIWKACREGFEPITHSPPPSLEAHLFCGIYNQIWLYDITDLTSFIAVGVIYRSRFLPFRRDKE